MGKISIDDNLSLPILGISRLKMRELGYIVSRNVFLLTNEIIFVVVVLLFVFGDRKAGLFLGIVSVINVVLGLFQDINAWLALEKLQLLTAPHVMRLKKDGSEESVLADEIKKGDRIKLKMGDQVPCDSLVLETQSLEINEGLITGESTSLAQKKGDKLLAGSVVTSGSAIIEAETIFHESRIARMTEGIKRYSTNLSPIQLAVNKVVKYSTNVLILSLAFVLARGLLMHEPAVRIVKNAGALTSMLVPIGLVFAVTLFFAYGAVHFFRRKVLLQEVNATEKLGRIKNLCMDKTGTLTENVLVVEKMHVPAGFSEDFAKELTAAYIQGSGDSSQTINAVKKFIECKYVKEVKEVLSFSSWRQYGAVKVEEKNDTIVVLTGSPDILLPHLINEEEKKWLQNFINENSKEGKRVLCVMRSMGTSLPHDLSHESLAIVATFVFYNNLRPGIRDTINFFQNRGVHIRIISGDNPETVRAVSSLAGIKDTDQIVTGQEMEKWSEADFEKKVKDYTIFARIVPEQKEKIIDALKKDGFTAMVGDGANDALAIKKANLGIAMFDGAPATRQLASVVLMDNSFTALPGGVELADSIIRNVEILASIFINITFVGFLLFVILSILGYEYPLTPLNITLINYFTVGIPGILVSYWAIRPSGKVYPASAEPFLNRILPFAVWSSVLQALGVMVVFLLSPGYLKVADSNTLAVLALIVSGYIFFMFTPSVYRGAITYAQRIQLLVLGIIETVALFGVMNVPLAVSFFDVTKPFIPETNIPAILAVIFLSGIGQYFLAKRFIAQKSA